MLRDLLSTGIITTIPILLASSAEATCTHSILKNAVDRYLAAQSTGQINWLTKVLAPNNTSLYIENNKPKPLQDSALTEAMRIDWTRTIYDLTDCATFTELIASDANNPHVMATQIHHDNDGGKVVRIDSVTSGVNDWLFNASHTLHYALSEDWSPIPLPQRDARAVIQAAGDAYFDKLGGNSSAAVPWGTPCVRLEGGLYNGKGLANDTCDVGIPEGSAMATPGRRYVVDEVAGVVSVFTTFTALGEAADSHLFRVEGGTLRFIHTVTNCGGVFNCGEGDIPPELGEDVGY